MCCLFLNDSVIVGLAKISRLFTNFQNFLIKKKIGLVIKYSIKIYNGFLEMSNRRTKTRQPIIHRNEWVVVGIKFVHVKMSLTFCSRFWAVVPYLKCNITRTIVLLCFISVSCYAGFHFVNSHD